MYTLVEEQFCTSCERVLPIVRDSYCMKCGKVLDVSDAEYCRDCRSNLYAFNEGRGLFLHTSEIARIIYQLKFHHRREFGFLIGAYMAKEYHNLVRHWAVTEVIPIPLHPKKQRQRGYNQAEEIARGFVEYINKKEQTSLRITSHGKQDESCQLILNTWALLRIRHTKPQKGMKNSKRNQNLQGAFAIRKDWTPSKRVLLIDDIYTTGSTLHKVAKLLKKSGVHEVYYLTASIGQGLS